MGTVICRARLIEPLYDEYFIGSSYVGADVHDFSEVKIFITILTIEEWDEPAVYLHSNYKNMSYDCATKLATSEKYDLRLLVENLIFAIVYDENGEPTEAVDPDPDEFYDKFLKSYEDDFTYYVDRKVLTDPDFGYLDFTNLKNLETLSNLQVPRESRLKAARLKRLYKAKIEKESRAKTNASPSGSGRSWLSRALGGIGRMMRRNS